MVVIVVPLYANFSISSWFFWAINSELLGKNIPVKVPPTTIINNGMTSIIRYSAAISAALLASIPNINGRDCVAVT